MSKKELEIINYIENNYDIKFGELTFVFQNGKVFDVREKRNNRVKRNQKSPIPIPVKADETKGL